MKKSKQDFEEVEEKKEEQEVYEENPDALVAMKRKSITVFRKKSDVEKYEKEGWVIV